MRYKDQEKHKAILKAAAKAFAENGFFSTRVSTIAEIAGVADGTIYRYFENKESILVKLFEEVLRERNAVLRKRLMQCSNIEERLYAITDCFLTDMEGDRDLAIVTLYEIKQPNKHLREQIVPVLKEYHRIVEEVLSLGIESGDIPSVDVKMGRRLINGTLEFIAYDWLFSRRFSTLEELRQKTFELFQATFGLRK